MTSNVSLFPSGYQQRLERIIAESMTRPLVGVLGEVGFNKTALIRYWLTENNYNFTWIEAGHPLAREEILSFLQHLPQPDTTSGDRPHFLVINGYQKLAKDDPIHDQLTLLAEQNPGNLRIIICSRITPPLPLVRLKAHNLYAQIDPEDLSFTLGEMAEYLSDRCGLSLSVSKTEQFYELTTGWPSVCRLILEHLMKHPDCRPESVLSQPMTVIPDLASYLDAEVFSQEPPEIQTILLKTCLPTEFDQDIVDIITEIQDSATILSELISTRCYLRPVKGGAVQYQPLFRAFLYHTYHIRDPHQVSALHSKLANLYLHKWRYTEAFCHAVAGNDYAMATSIIQRISDRYNALQFVDLIDGHLEHISSDLHFSDTSLFLTRCIPEKTLAEFVPMLQGQIRRASEEKDEVRLAGLQNRLGCIHFALGYIDLSRQILTESCTHARIIEDEPLLVCNLQLLADCYRINGDSERSMELARKALFMAEEHRLTQLQIHTLEVLCRLHMDQGELQKAGQYLEEALDLAVDEPFLSLWLFQDASKLALLKGDTAEAVIMAQKAADTVTAASSGYDIASSQLSLAEALMKTDHPEDAEVHLILARSDAEDNGILKYDVLQTQREYALLLEDTEAARSLENDLHELCRKYNYNWSNWYATSIPEAQAVSTDSGTTSVIEIRTMGSFEVLQDHHPVKIKRSSSISLLQFLLVNRGSGVNKEMIIDNIFPYDNSDNTNHFNVALSVLRKSLEPGLRSGKDSRYVLRHKQSYLLNEENFWIDITELIGISKEIMSQSEMISPSLISRFIELYRGDYMADYPYEQFLEAERTHIHRICTDTLLFIANYYRHSGDPASGIEFYERVLHEEPYYESVYLDYIDLLLSLRAMHKARDVSEKAIQLLELEMSSPITEQIEQLFHKHGQKYHSGNNEIG